MSNDRDLENLEWMFFSTLRRIHRSMDAHSKELEKQFGLTLPQLDVLLAVAEIGTAPIGRVATAVHLSKATLTSIADRLVDHGLLVRERSSHDKRQVELTLTDKSRGILARGPRPFHDNFSVQLRDLEAWQRTQLLSSLQQLAGMVAHSGRVEAAQDTPVS